MMTETPDLDAADEALVERLRSVLDEVPSPATQRRMHQALERFQAGPAERPSAAKTRGTADRHGYKRFG